jgi:UDP-GlcNAc3NAcA epimerase
LIKIINLVGARPQFIKAAAISRVLRNQFIDEVTEVLVHSGQHYDADLSDVFFEQLQLPKPAHFLTAPVATQVEQTGQIMIALERVLTDEKPDVLLIYGDTTTTLAGALVAAKMQIPIAHIEAGLRSYNHAMPEEINRVIADRLGTFLFVPTQQGVLNLGREGITHHVGNPSASKPAVQQVGDVMIDCLRIFGAGAQLDNAIQERLNTEKPILLLTLHRNFNADHPEKLREVIEAMHGLSSEFQVVFPVHPRTAKNLGDVLSQSGVITLPPVSYFNMLALEQRAKIIVTDSGGVQKEAFYFKKPLVILRPETEWTELLDLGVARLCDIDKQKIIDTVNAFRRFEYPSTPNIYGDGFAADKICETIVNAFR